MSDFCLDSEIFNVRLLMSISMAIGNSRKMVIFGCNEYSAQFCRIAGKPVFFVEDEPDTASFIGMQVFDVFDLAYMNPNEIYVVVIKPPQNHAPLIKILSACGLLHTTDYQIITHANIIEQQWDVHFGYSRKYDKMDGFDIYGEDNDGIRIVALGGHITDPVVTGYCWPQKLYEILRKKGIRTQIYNGGFYLYPSSTSLQKLIRDAVLLKPDIVISYSGATDRVYSDVRLEHHRYKRPFVSDVQERRFRWMNDRDKQETLFGIANEKDEAQVWADNMRIMHSICKAFGAEFIGLLQPCNYSRSNPEKFLGHLYKNYFASISTWYLDMYENYLRCEEYYDQAEEYIEKMPYMFSLRHLFENSEAVHIDHPMNVYEKGAEIVAANVYDILKKNSIFVNLRKGCDACFINHQQQGFV